MKRILTTAALCLASFVSFAGFDTPEKTITAFYTLFDSGKPASFAEFLPASYQKDLTEVIHIFASKMDGDVWSSVTALASTTAKTLVPKAEFLLPAEVPEADRADTIKATTAGLTALSTFMSSKAVTLESLKGTTSIALFDNLVTSVLPLVIDDAADPEIYKVVDSKKLDNGDVRLAFADGSIPKTFDGNIEEKTVDFRSVEGCWVPTSMADSWTSSMSQAKDALERLDFTSTQGQQLKAQLLMMVPVFKATITNLEKANSKDELKSAAGSLLMPLLMMSGGGL